MNLQRAQLSYVASVRRLAIARATYNEQPSAGRLHTVILYEAGVELASRYLDRAEDAAAAY